MAVGEKRPVVMGAEKAAPNGVATLGSNGQVPYEQIPHLANNVTLYVDAATGDDANDGTREMPFKTIQAAVDALPKDLGAYGATISIVGHAADSAQITINGFRNGNVFVYGNNCRVLVDINVSNCDSVRIYGVILGGAESSIASDRIIGFDNVNLGTISSSTIDGIGKTTDGVRITGQSNVSLDVVTFNNCRNAINTRPYSSGTRSIALVSFYDCRGSGNAVALLCSTAICTEWWKPISNIGADVAVQQELGGALIRENGTIYTG